MPLLLGVNVDHAATLRQARYRVPVRGAFPEPSPVEFALAAHRAGAHGITAHLREDRRHIQDADLRAIKATVPLPLNMEMAAVPAIERIALRLKPHKICVVPERRLEVTTEGGLDAAGALRRLKPLVARLTRAGIEVSLFIDPDPRQIDAAAKLAAPVIELHTGRFALARARASEAKRLRLAAERAHAAGIRVNAGHGLHCRNIPALFDVPHLRELNIGHAIVARALAVGAEAAVREFLEVMAGYPA